MDHVFNALSCAFNVLSLYYSRFGAVGAQPLDNNFVNSLQSRRFTCTSWMLSCQEHSSSEGPQVFLEVMDNPKLEAIRGCCSNSNRRYYLLNQRSTRINLILRLILDGRSAVYSTCDCEHNTSLHRNKNLENLYSLIKCYCRAS
jgi:hypothetical protein